MPLPAFVSTLEEVGEAFRGEYVQSGNGYALQVAGIREHPEVLGLKRNQDAVIEEKRQVMADLDKLRALVSGVDIDKAKALLEQERNLQKQKLLDEGKHEELLEQARLEYQQQIDATTKQRDEFQAKYRNHIFENAMTKAAMEAGVKSQHVLDVINRASQLWKVGDDDVLAAYDEKGSRLAQGETPLTPTEWIRSLRQELPGFFKPPIKGGGLSEGASTTGQEFLRSEEFAKMSPADKAHYGMTHGT